MASATDSRYGQKESSDQNFDYMFKILIIGNSSVGKTSFLFRYADDSFTPAFVSTVGIDFKVKTIYRNDKRIKLQIWVRPPGGPRRSPRWHGGWHGMGQGDGWRGAAPPFAGGDAGGALSPGWAAVLVGRDVFLGTPLSQGVAGPCKPPVVPMSPGVTVPLSPCPRTRPARSGTAPSPPHTTVAPWASS